MTNIEQAIEEKIAKFKQKCTDSHISVVQGKWLIDSFSIDLYDIDSQARETEKKAFGGCTNCYGKGYATQKEVYSGRIVKGVKRKHWIENKTNFCDCERGTQLRILIRQAQEKVLKRIKLEEIPENLEEIDFEKNPDLKKLMIDIYGEESQKSGFFKTPEYLKERRSGYNNAVQALNEKKEILEKKIKGQINDI